MVYITNDEMAALPEDPEQKFVELERIVRERLEEACRRLDQNDSSLPLKRRYMSFVLPAARVCGITALAGWKRPTGSDDDWPYCDGFIDDVDYCVTELRLYHVARMKQHTVALDAAAKLKLRHLLKEIRETVDKLEVSVSKKERLYARLTGLESEINRDRTHYQAVAALMIEACDDVGEAATRLEPVVRLVERIGAALGIAKRSEEAAQAQLPAPKIPKQIESAKKPSVRSTTAFDRVLDEEIPF